MKIRDRAIIHGFLFGLLLFMTMLIQLEAYGQENMPNVLILNSYHPGYLWSDDELTGVISTLRTKYPYLDPRIEYIDTKNFSDPAHLLLVKDYLKGTGLSLEISRSSRLIN